MLEKFLIGHVGCCANKQSIEEEKNIGKKVVGQSIMLIDVTDTERCRHIRPFIPSIGAARLIKKKMSKFANSNVI